MTEPVLLVLGLAAAVAFAIVAKRFALPYPIVFVLAGTALAFVPGLPPVTIAPDWIFLSILPPLLFSGGWSTDWALFRANLRPILGNAIGLVVLGRAGRKTAVPYGPFMLLGALVAVLFGQDLAEGYLALTVS